jgi:hypothetical protein
LPLQLKPWTLPFRVFLNSLMILLAFQQGVPPLTVTPPPQLTAAEALGASTAMQASATRMALKNS